MSDMNNTGELFDYDEYLEESGQNRSRKRKKKKKVPKKAVVKRTEHKDAAAEAAESIEHIKRMFDDALDEDVSDFEELTESAQPVEDTAPARAFTEAEIKKRYIVTGFIVIIMAVIGLVSTITTGVEFIRGIADNTQQKKEFERFIFPIVMCDPAPFDQTVKLRSDTMITAAVWDIILYEDKSKYESEFDTIIVPEVDVEQHATKLFGTGLSFTHETIETPGFQFYYDEDIKSYRVPSNPKYFSYSPQIAEMTRVGESYTLKVGYVSPTPAWLTISSEQELVPEKYVEYVVSKRGNNYTLVAIKDTYIEQNVDDPL